MTEHKTPKKTLVYDSVLADIIRGIYNTSSIITEGAMIEKYGVSKSPVREALLRLCDEGIITNVPRIGYRIMPLNFKELNDALTVRIILEQAALEMSFPHLDATKLARLESMIHENKQRLNTHDAYLHWEMNTRFHLTLCSFSGNAYLTKALESILKICLRGAPKYYGESWEQDLNRDDQSCHFLLLDSLKNHNLPAAKLILKDDISDFRSDFIIC